MPQYKHCSACKKAKPLEEFYRDRNTKGGFHCQCKLCFAKQLHGERERWKRAHRTHYTMLEIRRSRRIQEEAGCHSAVATFYPGYRLIKSLETAEVVEI